MEDDNLYKDVHNYTKFKLVEMLITRHQEGRLNLDNLNSIEDLVDDVLKTLAISGMKFYSELKGEFNENRD
jgi:predicted site-specific integrase-resolvase